VSGANGGWGREQWQSSLTSDSFLRSLGSWMSLPQPPPCATSMTCELGHLGFWAFAGLTWHLGISWGRISFSLLGRGPPSLAVLCLWAVKVRVPFGEVPQPGVERKARPEEGGGTLLGICLAESCLHSYFGSSPF
jgi:hypothetical protein